MNIAVAALLSICTLWSVQGVDSLQCYSCKEMKSDTECNQLPVVTCNSSSICFTQVEKMITQNLKITKRCAEVKECNATNYNMGLASRHTSCCSKNLCNVDSDSGTTNVTYNAFLLAAAFLALCVFKNI
ncbi:ly6/PLAUR domain-containing protein 6-like [Leptodactylus fuscus]|uniref:ly6/PLAUR domain-containing protein 6-like n=1 Tax=Leptodactylus fuscus TaxID=238119 RepID=UPI003F4EF146